MASGAARSSLRLRKKTLPCYFHVVHSSSWNHFRELFSRKIDHLRVIVIRREGFMTRRAVRPPLTHVEASDDKVKNPRVFASIIFHQREFHFINILHTHSPTPLLSHSVTTSFHPLDSIQLRRVGRQFLVSIKFIRQMCDALSVLWPLCVFGFMGNLSEVSSRPPLEGTAAIRRKTFTFSHNDYFFSSPPYSICFDGAVTDEPFQIYYKLPWALNVKLKLSHTKNRVIIDKRRQGTWADVVKFSLVQCLIVRRSLLLHEIRMVILNLHR